MKNKKLILLAIFGFLLVFLSRWKLFLTPGVIGHNWDWNIPFLREENIQAFKSVFFSWQESVFSASSGYGIGNIFVYFLGALSNGEVQSKALLFFVPLFAFVGSFIFLSFVSKKYFQEKNDWGVYLGSLAYAFAPSVFNDFVGGQLIYLVGYSFFPLYVYLVFTIFEEKRPVQYLFPLGLLSLIFSGSHFWWFALFILASVFVSFYAKQYRKFLLILAISLLSTAPILMYVLTNVGNVNEVMPESLKDIVWFSALLRRLIQTVDKVFLGAGYSDRNFFLKSLGRYSSVFFVISYLILIFALSNILFRFKKIKDKRIVFWSISIFLLGIFLVTSGRSPFGDFFIFLMRKVIFFRAFRTTFHFFVLVNLSFSILLSIGVSLWQKKKEIVGPSLIILFLLARLPLFIDGDNGVKVLKPQKQNSLDVYQVDKEFLRILEAQFVEPEFYRVLYIPATISPVYNDTPFQRWGQGADAEVLYSAKPILNDFGLNKRTSKFYDYLEENIVGIKPIDQKFLGFLSFKKIIRRRDVSPSFSKLANRYNDQNIDQKLSGLETILRSEYVDYYNLDKSFYLPHFYLPYNSIYYKGGLEGLAEVVNSPDYQLGKVIYVDDPLSLKPKNYQKEIAGQAETVLIKAEPKDKIADEELGTFRSQDYIELPFASFKPGTILHNLSLRKEKLDVSREKQSSSILGKRLLLANKRISELLKFGKDDLKVVDFFLKTYPEEMKIALFELEKMKKDSDPDFLKALAQIRSTFEWQVGQIRMANISDSSLILLDEVFGNINRTLNGFTVEHESKEFTHDLDIPKEGEYEIYIKDTGNQVLDISKSSKFPGWQLLESKYFFQGNQEYILLNEFLGKNLIGDNLKINSYSPDTVYKISFKYKALRDDSGKQPYFSVNESKAGNLFDKILLYTGNEFENFEIFFRSSGEADRAFVLISIPEYEDLKVEKIAQPEILLRRTDTGNSILDTRGITPKIIFVKINPTKYRIKIEGAKKPYTLVFSESFNQGWKLYINELTDSKINELRNYGEIVASYLNGQVKEGTHRMNFLEPATFETWGKKPVAEDRHFMANGYANSWKINSEDTSGQENYELIIEFEPQRLYYIGIFISFITLTITFVIMVISLIKEKRRQIRK